MEQRESVKIPFVFSSKWRINKKIVYRNKSFHFFFIFALLLVINDEQIRLDILLCVLLRLWVVMGALVLLRF